MNGHNSELNKFISSSLSEIGVTTFAFLAVSASFYFGRIDQLVQIGFLKSEPFVPGLLSDQLLSTLWLGISTMILTLTAVALPLVSFIVERSDTLRFSWEKKFLYDSVKLEDRFQKAAITLLFSVISQFLFPTYLGFLMSLALFICLAYLILISYLSAFRILSDKVTQKKGGFSTLTASQDKYKNEVSNWINNSIKLEDALTNYFTDPKSSVLRFVRKPFLNDEKGESVDLIFSGEEIAKFTESRIEAAILEFVDIISRQLPESVREEAQVSVQTEGQTRRSFKFPIFDLIQAGSANPENLQRFRLILQVNERFVDEVGLSELHVQALRQLGRRIRSFIVFAEKPDTEYRWENYLDVLKSSIDRSLRNRDRAEYSNHLDLLVELYERR